MIGFILNALISVLFGFLVICVVMAIIIVIRVLRTKDIDRTEYE